MKKTIAPLSATARYGVNVHTNSGTEFNITTGTGADRDCISIAGLNIHLSRNDLIDLGQAIADAVGGAFTSSGFEIVQRAEREAELILAESVPTPDGGLLLLPEGEQPCEFCRKRPGKCQRDPYYSDVYGDSIFRLICDPCADARTDDI